MTAQVGAGLSDNVDITFFGPLFDLASKGLRNRLPRIHYLVFTRSMG